MITLHSLERENIMLKKIAAVIGGTAILLAAGSAVFVAKRNKA